MTEVNRELTENLNNDIRSAPNSAFSFFSERGKRIYFPFKGILGQSAEAKNSKINATIGTASEEDGSPLTLECIEKLINVSPDFFLYTPSFGLPRLRELWKEQILKKNPLLEGKNFSIPVVTSALTHGLNICAYLFVNENDEIIISDLNWDNYELIFRTAFGAKFTYYETFKNNAYNTDGLIQAIRNSSSAKKIVLLNFPNNPAGYSLSKAEALKIKEEFLKLAEEGHNILVIIDDAYFGLFYEDDIFKESLFSLFADLHKNILAVKIDGPTKEDYVWSFRIGFITFAIKDSNEKQLKA
ncbi:MAG TPA: aminotransferase class I/II-fold pyridoxal phosphate-dependent enzyme, partial [Victivallales bacterium]|nr:aminotransferase class I/II-fold pyridoxal phosphate-dependent enzyme [Victivallales bacterium]